MKKQSSSKAKQDIIDAFWQLYCQKRIEKITVKEVMNLAGYNRSTFYQHFKDIYDVLDQLEQAIIPTIDELPAISIADLEFGMPRNLCLALSDVNSEYYFVLLGDKGDPAFASKLKQSLKQSIQEVVLLNTDVDPIEFDYMLEFVLSAMIGVMSYWFQQGKRLPQEQLMHLINELMEQGISNKINQLKR